MDIIKSVGPLWGVRTVLLSLSAFEIGFWIMSSVLITMECHCDFDSGRQYHIFAVVLLTSVTFLSGYY